MALILLSTNDKILTLTHCNDFSHWLNQRRLLVNWTQRNINQKMFMSWKCVWKCRLQNVDRKLLPEPSVLTNHQRSCGIRPRATSQDIIKISIIDMSLKYNNYTPASTKLKGVILVSPSPSVRLSVCGQKCAPSASSTILVGPISYLHRRCVACKVCFKIQKNAILANSLNL